jgi:hypothetical protein
MQIDKEGLNWRCNVNRAPPSLPTTLYFSTDPSSAPCTSSLSLGDLFFETPAQEN